MLPPSSKMADEGDVAAPSAGLFTDPDAEGVGTTSFRGVTQEAACMATVAATSAQSAASVPTMETILARPRRNTVLPLLLPPPAGPLADPS